MQAKMEEGFESDKKRSVQEWDGDEKEEETNHEDDHTESEESVSTSGWKGKGRERTYSPAERFSTPWINVTVSPALSEMPITPGDQIDFWITLKEGFNLIEFEARLVGRSELANGSKHEFLSIPSVPAEFDSFFLSSLTHDSPSPSTPRTFSIFMLFNHTCGCSVSRTTGATEWIPLAPSWSSLGNKIEYVIELVGKVESGKKDKKGKGKWKMFSGKTQKERFEIPLTLDTDCMYALGPSPPPLAPERFYRTQPISQESNHGRERAILVDLPTPLDVGFTTRAESAKLNIEMTTSPTYKGSPTLEPSFRYSLVVSLGRHHPTSIPLLLVSLKQTAIHAHFVLHKSTTILPSPSTSRTAGKESVQQPLWITHRDKRKSNPTDAGRQAALEPGTVNGEFELYSEKGEKGEIDGQEELFVKFEGEFVVDIWALARGEDRRLVPIRTCQLEITYDLTATIRFGPNFSSSIQLKSTNLPLHLEARNIPLVGSSSTSVVPATSSSKNSTLEKPSRIVHLKSPSISIPQPQASSSRLGIDDNLPAYVPPLASTSNFPSAAEEKRQLANSSQNDEVPSISTSTNLPPAYIDSNDPSSLTLSTLAVDEEVPEEPPSWEEAVREEAIEEWVAANACLGEET